MTRGLAIAGVLAVTALAVTALLLGWPVEVLAQGCAMCKTTLEGSTDPLVEAINTSVLFMMAMPYLVVGTIGGWIYMSSRRASASSARDPAEPTS